MSTVKSTPEEADQLPDLAQGVLHYVDDYLSTLRGLIDAVEPAPLAKCADLLLDAFDANRRVVLCGNGGSATTASHLACDLMKNILLEGGKPFEIIALTDSPSILLAWGNDTQFENIFAGQARTWLRKDDVLIAISASGNSKNVLKAVEVAKEVGAISIGWSGYGGGELAAAVDYPVVVRRRNMQQVEDMHLIFGHIVFSALRDRIRMRGAA